VSIPDNVRLNVLFKFAYLVNRLPQSRYLAHRSLGQKNNIYVASFCNGADDGFLRACQYMFNNRVIATSYGSYSRVAGARSFTGDFMMCDPQEDPLVKGNADIPKVGSKLPRYDIVLIDPALDEGSMLNLPVRNVMRYRAQLARTNSTYVLRGFFNYWHQHLRAFCYMIKVRQYNSVDDVKFLNDVLVSDGYTFDGVIHDDLDNKLEFYLIYRCINQKQIVETGHVANTLLLAYDHWMLLKRDFKQKYPCWLSQKDLCGFVEGVFGHPLVPKRVYYKNGVQSGLVLPVRFDKPVPAPVEVSGTFR